jgi:hypothetical protein
MHSLEGMAQVSALRVALTAKFGEGRARTDLVDARTELPLRTYVEWNDGETSVVLRSYVLGTSVNYKSLDLERQKEQADKDAEAARQEAARQAEEKALRGTAQGLQDRL